MHNYYNGERIGPSLRHKRDVASSKHAPPHTQQLSIPNILLFGAITVPKKGTERGKCAEDPITSNSDRTSDQDPNPTSEYLNYSYF